MIICIIQNIFIFLCCLTGMTDELKIMVSAKIPVILHDSMLEAIARNQFKDKTSCITEAIEKLLHHTRQEPLGISQNVRQNLQDEINRLQCALQDTPDKLEYSKLQAKVEEKDKQIEEKDKHIGTLQKELENITNMHNNYMMQMQTLINQKAIEVPGAKKPWWRFW
jgi:predicted RNase H-like nuclease (RuvC/YqgF family)